ncbi:MAG TPA: hypothetical protein VH912_24055 [Streptosporangiaceae bacterium]|jgi:hypothetical protein
MIGAAILAAALAGCGGSSNAASGDSGSGGGQGGGSKLTITEPKDGASVQAPFMLKFNPGVAIGPTDTGKDHVHVILDGKTDQYTVVTSSSYQIKNLSPGKHTIGVTLQHADHSPVGPAAQITVNVTGGGGTGGNTGGGGGGGGGYDYGNGRGGGGY